MTAHPPAAPTAAPTVRVGGAGAAAPALRDRVPARSADRNSRMEIKKVYEPVVVTAARTAEPCVTVHNKHLSDGLGGYELRWRLTRDGVPVESGVLPAPEAPPGGQARVAIPCRGPGQSVPGAEYLLTVSVVLRENTSWARAGHIVTAGQFTLGRPAARPAPEEPAPVTLTESRGTLGVSGRDVDVVLDRATGTLHSYRYRGLLLLTGGPHPAPGAGRAPVGVTARQPTPGEVVIELSAPPGAGPARPGTVLTVRGDGEIRFRHPPAAPGAPGRDTALLSLPPQYEHTEWYGRNPQGLLDRHRGGRDAMADVRWLTLTDTAGRGLTVRGDGGPLAGARVLRLRPYPGGGVEELAPRAETRLALRADAYRLLPLP